MSALKDAAAAMLIEQEGRQERVYYCPMGLETIGVGRNISRSGPGLRQCEIQFMLENDIAEILKDLRGVFDGFDLFGGKRQLALISMRHQLGLARFLKFRQTIEYIQQGKWAQAAEGVLMSRAAEQTPNRYRVISQYLEDENQCLPQPKS